MKHKRDNQRNIKALLHDHCCCGKTKLIACFECVCSLSSLRSILLPSMNFMAVQYFSCFQMTRFSKHYT